jgi:hypothetical protein
MDEGKKAMLIVIASVTAVVLVCIWAVTKIGFPSSWSH